MSYLETDVLIIGGGIAGSTAAIMLAENGLNVILLNKGENYLSTNTSLAQGGIAQLHKKDSPEVFIEDILKSGCYYNYPPAVKQVVEESGEAIEEILIKRAKVAFCKKNDDYDYAQEGAHTNRRILNVKDKTGKVIQKNLYNYMQGLPGLKILFSHTAIDLLSYPHHSNNPIRIFQEPKVIGAYVLNQETKRIFRIFARKVILATGGLGSIFLHSTNPDDAVGNGIAMANRAGARMANLEYIQFHPTALYHSNSDHFLISEAVRGEGAKLKNTKGEFFMKKYSKMGDLAPRDIVSRAIYEELLNNKSSHVLLDIASYAKINIKERFPTIHATCKKFNIDIEKESIPVVPAAHYSCGGILADLNGRTSVKNLFAIGEVAATGVHGANRLASVSLLEGVVWGKKSAEYILDNMETKENSYLISETPKWQHPPSQEWIDPALVKQDRTAIKYTMWNYSGIIRNTQRLERAKSDLLYLQHRIIKFYHKTHMENRIIDLRDSVSTALLVVHAALLNKNSKGAHYIRN